MDSGFDTDEEFETRGRNTPSNFQSPSPRRRPRKTSQFNFGGVKTVSEWGFKLGIVISVETKQNQPKTAPIAHQESPIVDTMPVPAAATSPQYRSHGNTSYNISDYSGAYAAALMKEDKSALERFGIHTASSGDGLLLPGGDDALYGTTYTRYNGNNEGGVRALGCRCCVGTVAMIVPVARLPSDGNGWIRQRT